MKWRKMPGGFVRIYDVDLIKSTHELIMGDPAYEKRRRRIPIPLSIKALLIKKGVKWEAGSQMSVLDIMPCDLDHKAELLELLEGVK